MFTKYSDWLRQSNSAAVYRQAFELADQMGAEVRPAVIKAIHRQSEIAWNEIKQTAFDRKNYLDSL